MFISDVKDKKKIIIYTTILFFYYHQLLFFRLFLELLEKSDTFVSILQSGL